MKFIFNEPRGNEHLPTMILKTNQNFYNEPSSNMVAPPHPLTGNKRPAASAALMSLL